MSTATNHAQTDLREAKKALYRDAIFVAAEEHFADSGYEATKVHAIAASAGVSLATLYAVFDKKWTIYRALQKRRLDELMEAVVAQLPGSDTAFTMIRRGLDVYLTYHMAHPNYLRMHLREGTAWAINDTLRSPEQTAAWSAGLQMMVNAFSLGIEQGVFVSDDPELMARTLVAMHQVRLALWIDRGRIEPSAEVVLRATDQLIRTFCRPEVQDGLFQQCGLT